MEDFLISHLLNGAEEASQLLDNISQLEQTLHKIYMFVKSQIQQNPLLSAKDLCVRYIAHEKQLRGHQTVKKPLVICGISTIQEDHPRLDSAVVETVPPNNTSAITSNNASGSFFHKANNIVVRDGAFYAAHKLVIKKVQDHDQTPQGIVEGAEVFTRGDVLPKKEIYKGLGYRIYSAYSTAKAREVKIKLYEGNRAKDRCLAAASFSRKVMHPNVLHLIGVSPLNSEPPFLVFDESTEWAVESIIASALRKGLKQSLLLGLQTVAGLSSGLDYLHTQLYPFASVELDHFVVGYSHRGDIVISFDPEVLADETRERDQPSGGNELDIFHGLCHQTFDAACKAHYESQKVQRMDLDELDTEHNLDQDRFEEIQVEADASAGTLFVDTKGSNLNVSSASNMSESSISSRRPLASESRKSNPSAHRRELVWRPQKNEKVSLEEIALQFQRFLPTFSTELEFNRRRGRYTTKTAHRCPGYNRVEITLTPNIARSAIVSHLTPIPHEICPVCKEVVKDAEILACICGRDDNESIPTIKCSTCSEWHHRPCVSLSENEDQSFVCQSCKPELQTELKTNKSQPPEQVRPWISTTTAAAAPDTVDEPEEILRLGSPPTTRARVPSQPSDVRWDSSLGRSNGSIQSVEPRSLQTKHDSFGHFTKDAEAAHGRYDQTGNASFSTSPSGVDFEPDNSWKEGLRKRIEERFQSMIADAKDNHTTKLRKAPDTTEARKRVEADYRAAIKTITSFANTQYNYQLDRERHQRRSTAGVPMTPLWTPAFYQEQQDIMNGIKQSNQFDNSVRTSSESPTEERPSRSAVPKPNNEPPALDPTATPTTSLPVPPSPSVRVRRGSDVHRSISGDLDDSGSFRRKKHGHVWPSFKLPWIPNLKGPNWVSPDNLDEPEEILRPPPTRARSVLSIDRPSQPSSDTRWDSSLGRSDGSIYSDEPRSPPRAAPEVWKPAIFPTEDVLPPAKPYNLGRRGIATSVRSTGSGAAIRPSITGTKQMRLETEYLKKMEEEAIRKDMEMKKRKDMLRRREQQLMRRLFLI